MAKDYLHKNKAMAFYYMIISWSVHIIIFFCEMGIQLNIPDLSLIVKRCRYNSLRPPEKQTNGFIVFRIRQEESFR